MVHGLFSNSQHKCEVVKLGMPVTMIIQYIKLSFARL